MGGSLGMSRKGEEGRIWSLDSVGDSSTVHYLSLFLGAAAWQGKGITFSLSLSLSLSHNNILSLNFLNNAPKKHIKTIES